MDWGLGIRYRNHRIPNCQDVVWKSSTGLQCIHFFQRFPER